MRTHIYLILSVLALSGFKSNAQSPYSGDKVDPATKSIIINKVKEIAEVKKYMHDYSNLNPKIFLKRQPLPAFNYYLVMVGIGESDNSFQATYNFCIEPKTYKLYYLDKMTDMVDPKNSVITLEQWRSVRSTPNFMKMHTYKNGQLVLYKYKR